MPDDRQPKPPPAWSWGRFFCGLCVGAAIVTTYYGVSAYNVYTRATAEAVEYRDFVNSNLPRLNEFLNWQDERAKSSAARGDPGSEGNLLQPAEPEPASRVAPDGLPTPQNPG